MSRRSIVKKRYPDPDPTYNSLLVSLLTARILKSGKKTLANNKRNQKTNSIKHFPGKHFLHKYFHGKYFS